jgi:hypothetical protein
MERPCACAVARGKDIIIKMMQVDRRSLWLLGYSTVHSTGAQHINIYTIGNFFLPCAYISARTVLLPTSANGTNMAYGCVGPIWPKKCNRRNHAHRNRL